jgi:Fe-S-cluster containining protein
MTKVLSSKSRAPKRSAPQARPVSADGAERPVKAPQRARKTPKPPPPVKARQRLPVYREARAPEANCTACGLCCSYVAIEIDAPTTVKIATQLLWYVYHEGVSLYANGDDWMVQFDTTCVHLQPDYRCGIYETRPHICREFSEQDCEVNTGDDGKTFYTAAEFIAHLKETRPRIAAFVQKNFAPPAAAPRQRLSPFEYRFAAVKARREALGV